MSRRTLHFLAAKVATDALAANGKLPTTRSFAIAADIHPATARRWLVDLRRIIELKAHDLQEVKPIPKHQKRRSPASNELARLQFEDPNHEGFQR